MRTKRMLVGAALCFASLIGSSVVHAGEPSLFVYSTIDALLAGAYDGDITVKQLAIKGDFGLGTYNRLDGEMVLLDGQFFHVKSDGTVEIASPEQRVPLAYVLPFRATDGFNAEGPSSRSLEALEAAVDARIPNKNLFYGVKVRGEFAEVRTRAISPQAKPYKPLAELVKSQSVFERRSINGTLIGMRSPAFTRGVSVPGWHWHFISDDRKFGGHALAATLVRGAIAIASVHNFEVELPLTDDFAKADQARDRAAELRQVEGDKR